jgi:hypothetical protein
LLAIHKQLDLLSKLKKVSSLNLLKSENIMNLNL